MAAETTAHGRLVEIRPHVFGRRVFARFVFSTGDAMGLNMINLAVDRICRHVTEAMECERYYLRCNYSSDKKPAAMTAMFIACGQDVAQVVNASIGFLDLELVGESDLYVAARLPNLVVGTVGGGTGLPTQSECLALLGCTGGGTARKFAEIVGATLVAGELAICAALANGRFIEAQRQNRQVAGPSGHRTAETRF